MNDSSSNNKSSARPHSRLSRIETQWSIVNQAHDFDRNRQDAVSILIDRYTPAIRRYLLACLRDEDAAEEVFQEFALKLVNGSFKNAEPEKGRFRNMIKTALYRLIVDHHRRKNRKKDKQSDQQMEHIAHATDPPSDESFLIQWRQSLLDEVWIRLEILEKQCDRPYYLVLRTRVDSPNLTTRELRSLVAKQRDDVPELSAFRVFLHRARKRFAAILVELVKESLDEPTDDEVESELIDLGLHHFLN